jgi:8-oxo-dGTP diphosphatase
MVEEYSSEKAFLADYNIHDFDVPLTCVDMSIFTIQDDILKVLLVKRAQYPKKGRWALPGGFINMNVDKVLDDTARRKLCEKTGIDTPYLEQVATFGSSKRDPRGWSMTVVYLSLISADDFVIEADLSSEKVSWVPVNEAINDFKLAFDHEDILKQCLERLKSKVQYSSLPVHLLPEAFTLSELQRVFEIVLEKSIEKKSFRRRILDSNILEETGNIKKGISRPAKLYRLVVRGGSHFFPRTI